MHLDDSSIIIMNKSIIFPRQDNSDIPQQSKYDKISYALYTHHPNHYLEPLPLGSQSLGLLGCQYFTVELSSNHSYPSDRLALGLLG